MKTKLFFIITLTALIVSLSLGIVAHAQGTSFDTAEEIATGKDCVYIDEANGIQYFKTHVSLPAGQYYTFYIYPSKDISISAAAYNDTYGLIGTFSEDSEGRLYIQIWGPYDGYVYIKVGLYTGSGYYNIRVDGSVPPNPDTVCSSSSGGGSGGGSSGSEGGGSSGVCPAGCNPPFPCSCPIFGWDPCAALANIYCAFASFGQAITSFFKGIVTAIQNFFTSIASFFTSIGEGIASFFQNLASGIMNGLKTIGEFLASIPRGIIDGLRAFVQGIADAIGSLFDAIGQNQIAQWIRDNGFIVLGVILILIGIIIRPAAWVGALLVFFGLMQHGFRIEYLFIFAGLILLVIIAGKR